MTEAERTGRGIALEDLQGIRERVRLRKPQRVTLPDAGRTVEAIDGEELQARSFTTEKLI